MKSWEKRITLLIGILGSLLVFLFMYSENVGLCDFATSKWDCNRMFNGFVFPFSPFLMLLLFTLITYPMKESVFKAWAKLSVVFVPILIIASFIFTGGHNGFGAGAAISDAFDYLILIILFSAYVIASAVTITRTYRRAKLAAK